MPGPIDTRREIWLTALLSIAVAIRAIPTLAEEPPGNKSRAGSTVQLPTFGVAIDADGVLMVKAYSDPGGLRRARHMAGARFALDADVAAGSKLRKISVVVGLRTTTRVFDRHKACHASTLTLRR